MTKKDKKSAELVGLINNLNKKYGNNAIQFGNEVVKQKEVKRIPTGIVSLDIALGGGVPLGRYIQIEGAYSSTKTTLSLHIIREAQKLGLRCAMVDAEGTTDKEYMQTIGINTKELLYVQPDGLEETIDMVVDMQRSQIVNLAVIDSLAVLKPIKELESDADETVQMGITPKLLGEFFGKYQMSNNRLSREGDIPFTLICTNQLREKIGVMYGCLHADTKINFVDGRSYPIKEIVENKIKGEVWSYNEEKKIFEPKEIIDWHYNGTVDSKNDYLYIKSYCPQNKNGVSTITVTRDHKILTKDGWKKAEELKLSDKLVSRVINSPHIKLVPIYEIRVSNDKQFRQRGKYDISVKDNKNYIAGGTHNGVVVHNSPEYAPGGRAKDFYSSVNIRLRRGDWLSQGTGNNKEIIGQVVKFKIDKNKTYKSMQTGEFDFYFAENANNIPVGHYDNYKSIIVESIMCELIDRGGAWYYLDRGGENELKFQGLDNLMTYFRENPELIDKYKEKIIDIYKKAR